LVISTRLTLVAFRQIPANSIGQRSASNTKTPEVRFAPASVLEGGGFEPSVPVAKDAGSVAEGELPGIERGQPTKAVSFAGYRWFESISLHRRVRRKPDFLTTPLPQRLRRAPDDLGDVVLTDANPSQMANLFAYRLIDDKTLF
jgi:hypothetical protein